MWRLSESNMTMMAFMLEHHHIVKGEIVAQG
jgi:hypothetical protein